MVEAPLVLVKIAAILIPGLLGFATGWSMHAGMVERVIKTSEPDNRGRLYFGLTDAMIGLTIGGGIAAAV